jgi:predicted aspartyl protease
MSTSAFTIEYTGISNVLESSAVLKFNDKDYSAHALWDTGATGTCISKDAASALNLVPLGKQNMHTPSGISVVNVYLIDILLPNNMIAKDIVVCDSEIGLQGIGVLIGMDIIAHGDFAVSNYNDKTVFTFRTPSKEVTDYTK